MRIALDAMGGDHAPGPIVAGLGKMIASFPIPVTIVPGHLTDEELDSLS